MKLPALRTWLIDLIAAVRHLGRSPGFALLAVLILALGIGANVAIFSLFRSIMLRPLPFAEPERLVGFTGVNTTRGIRSPALSASDFRDIHERANAFSALAAFRPNFVSYRPTGGDARQLVGALVTEDFFALYGVSPLRGRIFAANEFDSGTARAAILSRDAWRRHFGERDDILGAVLQLDDQAVTVVGVMPESFREPEFVDIWLPFPADAPENLARDSRYWTTVGRLTPGHTLAQAQSELTSVAASLEDDYPATNRGWSLSLTPLLEQRVGGLRASLLLLAGAVSLVLLVACVNLANLLLARGVQRLPEFAVRLALGASPASLMRGVLIESLVLGLLGGLLGAALASVGLTALAGRLPAGLIPRSYAIELDAAGLAFAIGVSLLSGLVFGLLPAWHVRRANVNEVLKSGGSRGGTSRFANRAQGLLVASQVAITLVVLTGAGLLTRGFMRLQATPPGFDPRQVLTVRIAPPETRWEDFVSLSAYYDRLADAVRRVPGVEAVSLNASTPLSGISLRYPFTVRGRPAADSNADEAVFNPVTADYLTVLRQPLLRGRFIQASDDRAAVKVCVINQTLAQRVFPDIDPIGQRLRTLPWLLDEDREIVGLVGDVRQDTLAEPPPPQLYVPQAQSPWFFSSLLIRTRGAVRVSEIQAALREADPAVALTFRTLEDNVARTTTQPALRAVLLGLFAIVALGLSAFGLYASLAFTVNQRTQEIGVRLALGAAPLGILNWILRLALRWCALGLAAGVPVALALGLLLRSVLPGVPAFDPWVLAGLCVVLPATALLACLSPALRASRLNPTLALQHT